MEMAGKLLDQAGNAIYSFDTSMTFGSPSKNPSPAVRIDSNLIKSVKSVSFTKIKAYTTQDIETNK